jgi:hypothetical protein
MSTWIQAFEEDEWHFASVFDSRGESSDDITHLLSPRKPAATQDSPAAMAAPESEIKDQDKPGEGFDPFPEPRTMPDGWNLTELL